MKTSAFRVCLLASALAVSLSAQTESAPPPPPEVTVAPAEGAAPAPAEAMGNRRQQRERNNGERNNAGEGNNNRRGNFNPAEIQARMMENMREQFGVKNDDEWALISERINAINELRRGQFTGAAMMFLGGLNARAGGGGGNRGFGGGLQANPEQDALRSAVADNLPDAEINARLTKFRDARKASEAKLDQARENLRSVLTLRQEAIAVMMGLLN